MKLRKTLYPVTVIIAIPLVIIVFILLNQGHFEQVDAITLENGRTTAFYFTWNGFGKPTIQSVEQDKHNHVTRSYLSAEAVEKNSPDEVQKTIDDHHPAFSVQLEPLHNELNPAEFTIHYKIFGIAKEQKVQMRQ